MGKIRLNVPRVMIAKGRYYWRPTPAIKKLGYSIEPLGADPIAAMARARELNEQVERTKNGLDPVAVKRERDIADLVDRYQASPRYKKLAENTRRGYDSILREIRNVAGRLAVAKIDRPGMVQMYEQLATRGLPIANAHIRVWQIIFGLAYDLGWRSDNPALKMNLTKPKRREKTWHPDQVAMFCAAARADRSEAMRKAALIAYDLGPNPGDIRSLPWTNYTGSGFTIRRSKTGMRVSVPFENPFLWGEIDAMPRVSTQVIICETTGRPFTKYHFTHEFARIRALAGLPDDLQFRDLRRTAATEWGEGGATDDQIRSAGAWAERGAAGVYVMPTETAAADAQEKRRKKRMKD